jgi:hypothetical protein
LFKGRMVNENGVIEALEDQPSVLKKNS